ncbi:hypothetical protein FKM82_011750 [Ascaphus truei]
MNRVERIPREIPWDRANGVRQCASGEIPRDTTSSVGQNISGEIPRDRANGAGQCTSGEIPRDRANGAGQCTSGEIPRDRANGAGQRTPGEIPRDRANGAGQRTPGEIPRDRDNGAGHRTPGEIPRDRDNGLGQRTPGEIPRDRANGAGQRTLGDIYRDRANGNGQSTPEEMPRDRANGVGQSISGEIPSDTANGAGQSFLGDIPSDTAYGAGQSILRGRINVLLGGLDPFYFHAVNVGLHCMASSLLMYTCNKAVFDDRRLAMAAALLFSVHPIHTEAVRTLILFLTYSYLLAFNVWLLLAPITLCYDWQVGSIPLIHSIWDRRNVGTLLLLGILISLGMHCLTASKRLEHRELLVGLLFLIFPFIPASNLFFRVGFVVAERVLYMPSMGFCILCVHGLKVLYSRCGPRGTSALTLCFLLLLLLFSCKSVSQSECWRSREVLFRSGVQALPHNAKVHYNFANFLKDQNRRDEAIHHYKTVLRLYPQHPSALNNLGTLTHNATAAEEYYRRALVISSQHSRALFNLGNLLKTQGRDDEAERLLRESLVHGPFLADAYSSLGSLLADQKRHKEAGDVYQTGIRSCPENPDLHNNYGVFLVDMGAPQEAMSHYLITLRLRPDHHVAMLNLGRLHRSLDQNTEAETWYKRALQFSRDKDVLCPLGALYYNTGRYEESLRLYQEAVALNPGSVQIRLSLAQVLAVAGHPKEAESLARRVTDEVTDCFECFRLLSAIYSKEENYAKALEMIDYALQMKPKDPKVTSELHFARGNQLRELNQLEEAFKSYGRVVDLNPDQAQAWMNMGGIKHIQLPQ